MARKASTKPTAPKKTKKKKAIKKVAAGVGRKQPPMKGGKKTPSKGANNGSKTRFS